MRLRGRGSAEPLAPPHSDQRAGALPIILGGRPSTTGPFEHLFPPDAETRTSGITHIAARPRRQPQTRLTRTVTGPSSNQAVVATKYLEGGGPCCPQGWSAPPHARGDHPRARRTCTGAGTNAINSSFPARFDATGKGRACAASIRRRHGSRVTSGRPLATPAIISGECSCAIRRHRS